MYKKQARGSEAPSVSAALDKADIQLARVALVIAESMSPHSGGVLPASAMETAVTIVGYSMDCWRALPEQTSMALTRKDHVLNLAVDALAGWLETRDEKKATKREVQQAHVGGVRNPAHLAELILAYGQVYPGCVREERTGARGPEGLVLYAPRRSGAPRRPEYTEPETVASNSFDGGCTEPSDGKPAGQGSAGASRGNCIPGYSFDGYSFLATVSSHSNTQFGRPPISDDKRQAILRRHVEGQVQHAIADAENVSSSTVNKVIHWAKAGSKRVRQCEHCLAYGPLTDGRCTDRAGCEKRQPTLEVNT
jgi:hypothetical protein